MRSFLAMLLLAAAASAQDHAELRKFIDSFRSERERANIELVLPDQLPPLPQRAWLTREFTSVERYGVLWIDSVRGGSVRVVRIRSGYEESEPGADSQGAIITRAQWETLARDLLLIREAKLRRVKGEPRNDRWKGRATDGQMRLELLTGDGLTVLADGPDVTPGLAPEDLGSLVAFIRGDKDPRRAKQPAQRFDDISAGDAEDVRLGRRAGEASRELHGGVQQPALVHGRVRRAGENFNLIRCIVDDR